MEDAVAQRSLADITANVVLRRPGARRLRFVKAYWTTFVVIASYMRVSLMTRLLGRPRSRERMARIHQRNARRIERTILELQGLFIKVGQLISIMTNFLPEEFRQPLESLQDQVPPRPTDEIRACVERELGASLSETFATFDARPLASASLGQVHRAEMPDGREVAVKVQHADIDAIAKLDLKTIWRILVIVRWFVPMQGLDIVYRQIREMVMAELDFEAEAKTMSVIGQNLGAVEGVLVPQVFPELCTRRVLTTAYVAGCKVSNLEQLDSWGLDRADLARRLLRAYCHMIFADGYYHADPHPGNVIVTREGTLVLLDFGAVGELSPAMRDGIPRFLQAVLRRDTPGIHRALQAMGFIAQGAEAEQVSERLVEYFHRRFQDEVRLESLNLKDIKVDPQRGLENLLDLRRLDIGFRELTSTFQVPKDWVLLERTLLLMSGVCTHLAPDMNPMAVVRPYLEEFVFGEEHDFATLVVNAIKDSAMSALSVPDDLRKYLGKAMRGELETRLRGVEEGAGLVYALGHQLIYALFTVTGAVFAWIFKASHELLAMRIAAGSAVFFGVLLFGSMLAVRRSRRR